LSLQQQQQQRRQAIGIAIANASFMVDGYPADVKVQSDFHVVVNRVVY
jgi:hypothetical protein